MIWHCLTSLLLLTATPTPPDLDYGSCVEFVYPITVVVPNGNRFILNEDDDWSMVERWYENYRSREDFTFVYPVEVRTPEGIPRLLTDDMAWASLRTECRKLAYLRQVRPNDCFRLEYPIVLVLPDGTARELVRDTDWQSIAAWYLGHDTEASFEFGYPMVATTIDGYRNTIESIDDLESLQEECYAVANTYWDAEDLQDSDCFETIYPITVLMPDGTPVSVMHKDDWERAEDEADEWYDNSDSDEEPTFQYPIRVRLTNGTIKSLPNAQAMAYLLHYCD